MAAFWKLLNILEKATFKTADVAIATNATFKQIAMDRGGMRDDQVYIVRSIPDLSRFKRLAPDLALKNGRKHLIGYVGIMGAQDGVDLLIEAMNDLVHTQGRNDVQCAIVGSGTELEGAEGHDGPAQAPGSRHLHRLPERRAIAEGVLDLRHRRHSRPQEHLQRQDLDE